MIQFRVQSWESVHMQRAMRPVEVTVTRGGKSILFLDASRGVSYADAAREHRARCGGFQLRLCAVGHLTIAFDWWQCPEIISYDRPCGETLREWRRVT